MISYGADKLGVYIHTDTHTDGQTQATTICEGPLQVKRAWFIITCSLQVMQIILLFRFLDWPWNWPLIQSVHVHINFHHITITVYGHCDGQSILWVALWKLCLMTNHLHLVQVMFLIKGQWTCTEWEASWWSDHIHHIAWPWTRGANVSLPISLIT